MRPLLPTLALFFLGAVSTGAACTSSVIDAGTGSSSTTGTGKSDSTGTGNSDSTGTGSSGTTDTGDDWPDDTSCAAWCVCNGVMKQQMLSGCFIGPSCNDLNPDAGPAADGSDAGACECVQMSQ